MVDLDEAHFRSVTHLDERFAEGVPSLRACTALTVRGPVSFAGGVILRGRVTILADSPKRLPPGTYEGTVRL